MKNDKIQNSDQISRPPKQHRFFATILLLVGGLLIVVLSGCRAKYPMTTSLNDLNSETRRTSGGVFEHHEVLSTSGLLPMTESGLFIHYPPKFSLIKRIVYGQTKDRSPITALGISPNNTFRLVGTSCNIPMHTNLVAVQNSLIDTQLHAINLTQLTESLIELRVSKQKLDETEAEIKREIDSLEEDLKAKKKEQPEPSEAIAEILTKKDGLTKDLETNRISQTNAAQQIENLDSRYATVKTNYQKALKKFRESTSVPGIMLANWTTTKTNETSGKIDESNEGSIENNKAQNGLVILGGIRVSALYPGDDFYDLYLNLSPANRKAFHLSGLITYVLQAKHVLSVNELDVASANQLNVALKGKYFTVGGAQALLADLEEINLSYQAAISAKLNNLSSIGQMTWKKEEVTLVSHDTDWINKGQPATNTTWRTVHAVISYGKKFYKKIDRAIKSSPEIAFPSLAPYETQAKLGDCAKTKCRDLNTELSKLKTYTQQDRSYLLNDRLYKALCVVNEHIKTFNRQLLFKEPDSSCIEQISTLIHTEIKKINEILERKNGWKNINQQEENEFKILLCINQANAKIRQY